MVASGAIGIDRAEELRETAFKLKIVSYVVYVPQLATRNNGGRHGGIQAEGGVRMGGVGHFSALMSL